MNFRFVPCRGCGKSIIFLKTESGKSIPVNAENVEPDDYKLDRTRHTVHFQTCPKADKFRKKEPPKSPHWQERE